MFSVPLDIASGSSVAVFAGLVLAITLIGPIVVEAIVLWLLRWGGFWRSVLASLLANIVTIIVGVILVFLQFAFDELFFLSLSFVLSVVIEAGVLILLKHHALAENWRTAFIANLASYLLVIAPLYFFF